MTKNIKQIDFYDVFNRGETKNPLTGSELYLLINAFDTKQFEENSDYYAAENPEILSLTDSTKDPNNVIPIPFARYAVDTTVGYAAKPGNITYKFDDEDNEYVKQIKEILDANNANLTTTEVFQDALINGEGAELLYYDEYPQFVQVDRDQCIFVYDTTIKEKLLYSVRYYKTLVIENGYVFYRYFAQVYHKNRVDYYKGVEVEAGPEVDPQSDNKQFSDRIETYEFQESQPHVFNAVPLYPAKINKDKKGLFQPAISMIDRLDKFGSVNISDELDKFSQIYLLMSKELDTETLAKIRQLKVFDNLGSKVDGDYVEFLQKQIDIAASKEGFELFERLFYELLGIPNLNEEKFNVPKSGVAMLYALLQFENKVSMMEMYFSKALMYRLDLIQNALKAVNSSFQYQNATLEWRRNIPEDMQTRIDIAKALNEIGASRETIFNLFPDTIIKDAGEEIKKIAEEEKESIASIQEKQNLLINEPKIDVEDEDEDEEE
jgi:SPP1 family phage portal protein